MNKKPVVTRAGVTEFPSHCKCPHCKKKKMTGEIYFSTLRNESVIHYRCTCGYDKTYGAMEVHTHFKKL